MPDHFTIGVAVGVTPDRWVRVWRERLPSVELRVVPVDDPSAALSADVAMVFARLPVDGPEALHLIPLWEETQVVVAARDHPVKAFESVLAADLAGEEEYPGWDEGVLDIVAAGHGIARMPQSVFRATGRRDLVARPIADAEPTRIALVWPRTADDPLIEEFIGIVRGRTANTSRGESAEAPVEPAPPTKRAQPKAQPKTQQPGRTRRPPPRTGSARRRGKR